MDQKDNVPPPAEEPLIGTLDIFLLIILLVGAVWYLLRRRNQVEVQPERTYSIQWVTNNIRHIELPFQNENNFQLQTDSNKYNANIGEFVYKKIKIVG